MYLSDVWSSSDGASWDLVRTLAWNDRYYHCTVVFNYLIWMMGGKGDGDNGFTVAFNDVWYSSGNSGWDIATSAAPWSARHGCTSVVFTNDLMWVMAGSSNSGYVNDVWSSSDGVSWTLVTSAAAWSVRSADTTVVFDY